MPLPTPCRHPDCPRPRSPNSVFCYEHHAHHLWRVGLGPEHGPQPALCRWLIDQCRAARTRYEEGRHNHDEYLADLLGVLLYAELKRAPNCWPAALRSLPPGDTTHLLAYATTHPAPALPAAGFASESARQAAVDRWSEIHARFVHELHTGAHLAPTSPDVGPGYFILITLNLLALYGAVTALQLATSHNANIPLLALYVGVPLIFAGIFLLLLPALFYTASRRQTLPTRWRVTLILSATLPTLILATAVLLALTLPHDSRH